MLNIVLVGGGDLGSYVASILSKERHNVILIDTDPKVLEQLSTLDVATRLGSGTDWQLLDDLLEFSPDRFLALTGNDETNLVACSIAKQLQYPRTIARVKKRSYLNRMRLDFGRIFDVDSFIAPEVLVAHDIVKQLTQPYALHIENFANGTLQLRTYRIPPDWHSPQIPLKQFNLPANIIVGLILRKERDYLESGKKRLIFPHGEDTILPGDEVTFIGATEAINQIHHQFGIPEKEVHHVVLIGGSATALHLAHLLTEQHVHVSIIEKDYQRCCFLAEKLPSCTIMQHDARDLKFLESEQIGHMEILISCTSQDEINLLTALLGRQVGCQQAFVLLNHPEYIPILNQVGINHTASPRITATNHILTNLMSGRISSLVSLYDNQAEIIEIRVSMTSKIVGIPLLELGPYLPKDLLIVMIENRGRLMIAHGSHIISPGDTVIVVTSPQHIEKLEKIF